MPVYLLDSLHGPLDLKTRALLLPGVVYLGLQTEPKSSPTIDPDSLGWWGTTKGCPHPSCSGPAFLLTMSRIWAVATGGGLLWDQLLLDALGLGAAVLFTEMLHLLGMGKMGNVLTSWHLYFQLNINPRDLLILHSMTKSKWVKAVGFSKWKLYPETKSK